MKKGIVIILTLLIMAGGVFAQSDEDFEVTQNKDNTLTITDYKGKEPNVVIPSTLWGLKVTAIGDRAFNGNKLLESIVIPDTVTSIGKSAFAFNANLKTVTLGKGLITIGEEAFQGCKSLAEIVIPDSVTSIEKSAFSSCGLTKVVFGKGIKTIKSYAFRNCNLTELINFPPSVQTIEVSVFEKNKLKTVVIPTTVKLVGYESFSGNPIETLVIPTQLAKQTRDRDGNLVSGIDGDIFGMNASSSLGTLNRITVPAGMDDRTIAAIKNTAFANFFTSQNKAAGTYVKNGPIWSKGTTLDATAIIKETEAAIAKENEAIANITGTWNGDDAKTITIYVKLLKYKWGRNDPIFFLFSKVSGDSYTYTEGSSTLTVKLADGKLEISGGYSGIDGTYVKQ